jgi:hypothetical protein
MFGHISLEEVIQERMVLDGTVFPNMKGAVALNSLAGNLKKPGITSSALFLSSPRHQNDPLYAPVFASYLFLVPFSHVMMINSKRFSIICADAVLVKRFLVKRFSTMQALVRVIGHSSKTKVQEPFGFVRLHEAMRVTYYFSGFPETSCDVQPQNISMVGC